MPRPGDNAKPPAPNTLRDQVAPNMLRSPGRLSGRADVRDEPDARDPAQPDDQIAAPAPPPPGHPPWTQLDVARFESERQFRGDDGPNDDEPDDETETESVKWPERPDAPPDWTATGEAAARDLAELARHFETASLRAEAGLVLAFQHEAAKLAEQTGRLELTETDDERITIDSTGAIAADVILEGGRSSWQHLATPEQIVAFFDPTNLFDDIAEALTRSAPRETPKTPEEAAAQLDRLASRFRGRTGKGPGADPFGEARLLEEFEEPAQSPARAIGEMLLVDAADERVTFEGDGRFRAAVVPDDEEGSWKTLRTPDELVEYYTPAELLDHLTARLRSAYHSAAEADTGVAVQLREELARDFAARSRTREIDLLNRFEVRAADLARVIGDFVVVDDEDERLMLGRDGHFSGSIVPKDRPGRWEALEWPDELVEFYDPADMFADLADALAEEYPSVAAVGGSRLPHSPS